jgi:hypothetical protein
MNIMKILKFHQLIGFLVLFGGNILAQSANTVTQPPGNAPSDAVKGYTYDFDMAKQLIVEYQINPNENNKDAKSVVEFKKFPKLSSNDAGDLDYQNKLTLWMEKNPEIIIEAFKNRKDIVHKF